MIYFATIRKSEFQLMRTTIKISCLAICVCVISGCGTTTQKIATEQLLISDAVDQAVEKIDFTSLAGEDVFLDTKYLHSVKGTGYANADYIISALREQLSEAGCRIQDTRAEAKTIVEPRVGALGTDGHEITYGIPQTNQLSSAAAAISSAPAMPIIPEISFGKSDKQMGVAKITVFAYDRESKIAVWQSGQRRSESTSNNTWVLGAGPFQKGTIHEGVRFAGNEINQETQLAKLRPPFPNFRQRLLSRKLADSPEQEVWDRSDVATEPEPAERVADNLLAPEDKQTIAR